MKAAYFIFLFAAGILVLPSGNARANLHSLPTPLISGEKPIPVKVDQKLQSKVDFNLEKFSRSLETLLEADKVEITDITFTERSNLNGESRFYFEAKIQGSKGSWNHDGQEIFVRCRASIAFAPHFPLGVGISDHGCRWKYTREWWNPFLKNMYFTDGYQFIRIVPYPDSTQNKSADMDNEELRDPLE